MEMAWLVFYVYRVLKVLRGYGIRFGIAVPCGRFCAKINSLSLLLLISVADLVLCTSGTLLKKELTEHNRV